MNWIETAAYFFGGATLANAVPHLVRGMCGQSFQSPFAKPSGRGLSSATVNVVWGLINLAFAYGLTLWVGQFDARVLFDIGPFAAGAALIALFSAQHFGQFHGGNLKPPL
jgi:hypothetical protein